MRRNPIIAVAFSLTLLIFWVLGCSGNSPSSPQSSNNSGVSPNPNGPIIEAFYLSEGGVYAATGASVFIVDNASNPVTNAAVTLITSGGSYPVTYAGTANSAPPANTGITNIYGGHYLGTAAYTGGGSYSFQIAIGSNSYASTFTALNSTSNAVTYASGVTCTFTGGGNANLIYVTGNDNFQDGPSGSVTSPYFLPASDFPSDPAGSGNDIVTVLAMQTVIPAFSGCKASSAVGSGTAYQVSY